MLFKLFVCVALLCLKDKSQMWCLVLFYAVWLRFVMSGQPHIAHRKVYSELLGVFANLCVVSVPLLVAYGVIPKPSLAFLMMTINMGTVLLQILVEMAAALQALSMIPGFQQMMPCFPTIPTETIQKLKDICEKVGGSGALLANTIAKPLAVVTLGYTAGYVEAVSEWVAMSEGDAALDELQHACERELPTHVDWFVPEALRPVVYRACKSTPSQNTRWENDQTAGQTGFDLPSIRKPKLWRTRL